MIRALPVIAAILATALFCRLGFWQLDRAEEKEILLDGYARSTAAAPKALSRYEAQERFQRVVLAGRFLDRQFLLDNQILDGEPGVHVLAPFAPADGGPTVLVNRGWLPIRRDRRSKPAPPPLPDLAQVHGHLSSYPRPGLKLGQPDYTQPEPWLIARLDPETLSPALKLTLAPQILLQTEAPSAATPDAAAAGLVRRWLPDIMPPSRHRGYAFQWFSLAAAVVLVTLIVQLRRKKDADG